MKAIIRICLVFALLILLSGASFNQPSILSRTSVAQGAPSCPQNSILKMTMFGGTPNTFNLLSASTQSAFVTLKMMYWGLYPPPNINGTLDWNDSITDSVQSNSNYTQWTFHVKPGLTWSNGQPVTGEDIVNTYSSKYGLNATVDFVNAHLEVTNVSAPDNNTAVFVLNKSDAHFPEKISDLIYTTVMPQSFVQNGPAYNGFGTTDVGVGPFYVSNYSASSTSAVLYRNQFFKPTPSICEIQMNYVETDSQIATYMLAGTTDLAPVEPSSVSSIVKNSNVHIVDEKGIWLQAIDYNVSAYPYNMTAFRQALVFGLNLTQIQQQAFSGYDQGASAAQGGIPQLSSRWYNPNQKVYSYDPTQALTLLNSIGITKGSDGFLHYPNGTAATLTLWYANDFTSNTLASGIIQSDLQSLGFHINLVAESLSTIVGDTFGNVNNIGHAMVMELSTGSLFGLPYLDALPNYDVDMLLAPYSGWEGDPVGQANYQSNLTALENTANTTLEYKYLANIQALNAQYVPAINLGYPDSLWAYNSQRFTNWPSQFTIWDWRFNSSALAGVTPVSASTSAASSSISTSQIPTTQISSSSGATSLATSTSSVSTSNGGSGLTSINSSAAALIVVIIIIGAALLFRRREESGKS